MNDTPGVTAITNLIELSPLTSSIDVKKRIEEALRRSPKLEESISRSMWPATRSSSGGQRQRAGVIPKTAMPGVGQLVSFKDTEGNVMAVLEANPAGQWEAQPPAA